LLLDNHHHHHHHLTAERVNENRESEGVIFI
jgi:hypothetical protein